MHFSSLKIGLYEKKKNYFITPSDNERVTIMSVKLRFYFSCLISSYIDAVKHAKADHQHVIVLIERLMKTLITWFMSSLASIIWSNQRKDKI